MKQSLIHEARIAERLNEGSRRVAKVKERKKDSRESSLVSRTTSSDTMTDLLSYVDLSQKSLWIAVGSIIFVRQITRSRIFHTCLRIRLSRTS